MLFIDCYKTTKSSRDGQERLTIYISVKVAGQFESVNGVRKSVRYRGVPQKALNRIGELQ